MVGGVSTRVTGITSKSKMPVIKSNEQAVYTASSTGCVHRISDVEVSATMQLDDMVIEDITLGEESLFAVTNRKDLIELDATTLEEKRRQTLAYDPFCVALVKSQGELWLGDKNGKMHILAADSLEEKSEFEAAQMASVQCL